MKKSFLIMAVMSLLSLSAYSQVIIGGGVTTHNAGEPTAPFFLNANTNYSSDRKDNSKLVGKGLYFPRVDLSASGISFGADLGSYGTDLNFDDDPTNWYFTYLDGLVVYNTATGGTTPASGIIGSTEGTLKPGFWYYDNRTPVGADNNEKLKSGTWKQLGSGGSSWIYMPSFPLDVEYEGASGSNTKTVNLTAEYRKQFFPLSPAVSMIKGEAGEQDLDPEIEDESYRFFVIGYDTSVFDNVSLTTDAYGVWLNYTLLGDATDATFMNIIMVKNH
jgi:hypothetical protein